ncbi:MAG: TetR/AcrR family transcriptional regulator [Thermodesulfobacteriota bacterium]
MNHERVEKRKSEILSASMDAFAENGYHATKISDIAERLGIGHGTFYRYFKNKLDIFSSVLDLIIGELVKVVEEEEPDATNTLEEYRNQILRIGRRMYTAFIEDTRMAQIIFYEALGVSPDLNEKMNNLMALNEAGIELYLKNGIAKGFLKPGLDTAVLAKAINTLMFGGGKDILAAKDPGQMSERWIRSIALLMLDGMGTS